MANRDRADIRTRARIRADQDNSTFPTDTQYNYFIAEAAQEVWYDLVQAGWPVNFSSVNKTATGTNPLVLGISGNVAFIRGVYYRNSGSFIELQPIQEGDRASLMSTSGVSSASHYAVRHDATSGPVLELLPLPSSGSYRVEYVLEHAGFASDAAVWYGPGRSDELLVLRAAIKGMRKEGNDQGAAQCEREYAGLWERVTNMASWFNQRHSAMIRDVGTAGQFGGTRDLFDYDI